MRLECRRPFSSAGHDLLLKVLLSLKKEGLCRDRRLASQIRLSSQDGECLSSISSINDRHRCSLASCITKPG